MTLVAQLGDYCTGNAKAVVSNPVQSVKSFSGHFSSSAMGAFASIICLLFKNHDTAFTGMLPTLSWGDKIRKLQAGISLLFVTKAALARARWAAGVKRNSAHPCREICFIWSYHVYKSCQHIQAKLRFLYSQKFLLLRLQIQEVLHASNT